MADDIKIIEQIEKQIGEKLAPLPLKNIRKLENNGFTLDNAGQIQRLNLNGTKVKDISFLSKLGGLTHLSLENNQITDLTPLRELMNLTNLNLKKNQITDLTPLRELKNLTVLNLHENEITDITPLRDMAKLEELYLSKNKIMKLTVLSFFKNLKKLGLGDCQIADPALTHLSTLTNLETLALYENQITDITPLRELKNLKVLDVRRNRIEKLPPEIITWWPNLEIKWEDNFIPGLILLGNPLIDHPVEIVKQGKADVKNYFNITPKFEIDIFISYCHYDNAAPPDEKGRVDRFHERLESLLVTRFGHKKVSIWRDKKLHGSTFFDKRIQEQIHKSALFFALLSSNYLNSDYCLKELEWFHQEAEKSRCGLSINNESRIFNVLLRNIPHSQWPEKLQGTSGFSMHDQNEDSGNLGDFLDYHDPQYNKKLRPIVDAVEKILNFFGSFSL
ncbi:MAG: hypothetical protein QG657_2696 [Acidobacteriota bacterium]|nr:hypothetical protein [Acidobacteriota bacterium]